MASFASITYWGGGQPKIYPNFKHLFLFRGKTTKRPLFPLTVSDVGDVWAQYSLIL